MKKMISLLTSIVLLMQTFCMTVAATSIDQFSDVKGHWAENDIEVLCGRNIINGYGNGTFAPDNPLTRAEAAKLVCLSADFKPDGSVSSGIPDVEQHWAKQYINVLPLFPLYNNNFLPDNQITRADFAIMVVAAMHMDVSEADTDSLKALFNDWESISAVSAPYVALAVSNKLINGYGDSTFRPNNTLTRAEACAILNRAFFPAKNNKPSQYYVETVTNAIDVYQLVVTPEQTVYYESGNKVYRADNGKSDLILDGSDITVVVTPDEVISQLGPKDLFSDLVINMLEKAGTQTIKGFEIANIVCDQKTNQVYALAYNTSLITNRELTTMILVDIHQPQNIRSKVFGIPGNTIWDPDNIPDDHSAILNNDTLYYSTLNYYGSSHFDTDGKTLQWKLATNQITEYADFNCWKNSMTFKNDELWYINTDFNPALKKFDLLATQDIYKIGDDCVYFVCACKDDFYYWVPNKSDNYWQTSSDYLDLYHISLSDLKPEKLIDWENETGFTPKITLKDNLRFIDNTSNEDDVWVADSEGVLYFYDSQNNAIRKLYGV